MGLVFDEKAMLDGNIFKYEERLQSNVNRYIGQGALLTCWYINREDSSTVDRGLQSIDELFGKHAPTKFNKIYNHPVYNSDANNPNNVDENDIEDITIEGEFTILPNTIIPTLSSFFTINHLKMIALFQVTSVEYDSMKVDGFYKVRYRLISTSAETINNLETKVVEVFYTDLNSIGTKVNPIIEEDNFIKRNQINQMVNKMINAYRALYYNSRHNCFLYYNEETRLYLFDLCGNEFIAKYNLLNIDNNPNVIMLHNKINDAKFPLYYNDSIYSWLELGCPKYLLQKFNYYLKHGYDYVNSSFHRWNDLDVYIMIPLNLNALNEHNRDLTYFDNNQFDAFLGNIDQLNDYEKLIFKYINDPMNISINDISLYTSSALLSSVNNMDVFIYTPIILYIIKQILRMT